MLDNLKDIKSSVLNDFAAYKRSMAIVRDTLDDEDYDQEVKNFNFLGTSQITQECDVLRAPNKVQRVVGYAVI